MVVGGFGQDAWAVSPWLTFDAGVRYDATTGAANAPVSPRAGWTLARSGGRTTFSGSAGLFADTLPLAALGFSALPSRQVVTFDADGHASTVDRWDKAHMTYWYSKIANWQSTAP